MKNFVVKLFNKFLFNFAGDSLGPPQGGSP